MSRHARFVPLVIALFALLGERAEISLAQPNLAAFDETKEPPLRFTLNIGDKSISITEGEATRLDGTFTDALVTLTALPYRTFSYGDVSFDYPRSYVFEADLEDRDAKTWTLSGNDFKIMYFVMNVRMSSAELAASLAEQFGRENCELTNAAPWKFGDSELSGTTINVSVAGQKLVSEIYRIPLPGPQTRLLVLQDSPGESDDRSKEAKTTIDLLSRTAKWKR